MCLPELPYAVPGSNGRGEGICCSDPLKKNKCPKNSAIGYCFHDPSTLDEGWSTGTGAECVDYRTHIFKKEIKKLFCTIEKESQMMIVNPKFLSSFELRYFSNHCTSNVPSLKLNVVFSTFLQIRS